MRLLHTSDLHLGQNFFGRTRQAEHDAFLRWLVEQVHVHAVDAVIVAGDLFDTAMPPSHAREQCNRFIDAMIDTGAQLVLLGGNHDSPATLGEAKDLLARLSTRIVPKLSGRPEDHVFVIPRRDRQPGMVLCAIPFIRQGDVATSAPGQRDEDKRLAVVNGIARQYAAIHAAAVDVRARLGIDVPIVATGHLATVGASSTESVREIYVGSINAFPTDAFPPADYIALGHIHRAQRVGDRDHIRYSGAPIPLGFDELDHQKQVLLVEFDGARRTRTEPIPVPTFQPLLRVRGALDALAALLAAAAAGVPDGQRAWLEVTVEAGDYLPDLQVRVTDMVAGLPLDVLRLRRARAADAALVLEPQPRTLEEMSVHDVFEQRLAAEADLPETRIARLRACFADIAASIDAGDGE